MVKSRKHKKRVVTGRSYTIHTRAFATEKTLNKLNQWILGHRELWDDIFLKLKGREFDRVLGAKLVGQGIYIPEGSDTKGLEAHTREKKVVIKYLGLIRKDGAFTHRMDDYRTALQNKIGTADLLRDYALKLKLDCPQIWSPIYKKSGKQASYGHYRIRPIVLALYAINKASKFGLETNTDDVVLCVIHFFPPNKLKLISEVFLKKYIDSYLAKRKKGEIDYKKEYLTMNKEVEREIGIKIKGINFRRKARNSANDSYCLLIFLRNLGLIETKRKTPPHWSGTQQSYGSTPPLEYNTAKLTPLGVEVLKKALNRVPVWYRDLLSLRLQQETLRDIVSILQLLATKHTVDESEINSKLKKIFTSVGIKLKLDKTRGVYVPEKIPLFETEYDIK